LKHQQRDLTHVLHRSVELTVVSGHSKWLLLVTLFTAASNSGSAFCMKNRHIVELLLGSFPRFHLLGFAWCFSSAGETLLSGALLAAPLLSVGIKVYKGK